MTDTALELLIKRLSRLQASADSAQRTALYLLKHKEQLMIPLAQSLEHTATHMRNCAECGNLSRRYLFHLH